MKTSHFLTFVGGAIAGAAIALLFAPDKGEQTRRRIKEYVDAEAEKYREMCRCGKDGCDCDADKAAEV